MFSFKIQIKVDGKFFFDIAETGYTYCFNVTNNLSDDDIKEILDLLTLSELREILCILKQVDI